MKVGAANIDKGSLHPDKGIFKKFGQEVQSLVFGVLFVLLKEEDTSIIIPLIINGFQFFQLLIFPFHPKVPFPHPTFPNNHS
jgi:hypothetical protein